MKDKTMRTALSVYKNAYMDYALELVAVRKKGPSIFYGWNREGISEE
jgi:hypothetical protein